jgi:hypothetical protein
MTTPTRNYTFQLISMPMVGANHRNRIRFFSPTGKWWLDPKGSFFWTNVEGVQDTAITQLIQADRRRKLARRVIIGRSQVGHDEYSYQLVADWTVFDHPGNQTGTFCQPPDLATEEAIRLANLQENR